MATHFSILAWRIPWAEVPGGTLVHGVAKSQTCSDAIQPSHPLSSPSPPAFNLSQHQCLFK